MLIYVNSWELIMGTDSFATSSAIAQNRIQTQVGENLFIIEK